jgi:hypothetical protein
VGAVAQDLAACVSHHVFARSCGFVLRNSRSWSRSK